MIFTAVLFLEKAWGLAVTTQALRFLRSKHKKQRSEHEDKSSYLVFISVSIV